MQGEAAERLASQKQPTSLMDRLAKIVTYTCTNPDLMPHYKKQSARVVSVVVHENEPPERGVMIANLEYQTFKEIEISSIQD